MLCFATSKLKNLFFSTSSLNDSADATYLSFQWRMIESKPKFTKTKTLTRQKIFHGEYPLLLTLTCCEAKTRDRSHSVTETPCGLFLGSLQDLWSGRGQRFNLIQSKFCHKVDHASWPKTFTIYFIGPDKQIKRKL